LGNVIRKTFKDVEKDPSKNVFDVTRDGKKNIMGAKYVNVLIGEN
jgi:hypothetical protein